ncbi:MAG: thiamine-phosphate kinase [Bacteroidales bacterium]|nr:thiamine-phosphate kinase [Bacteroidales bacterium]
MEGRQKDIKALGEFGLIELLTRNIELKNKSSLCGVGDDAAIVDFGGKKVVLTTDMLTEGVHFNLVYTPLRHLGYKAVVVNLSDVYAMNARPQQVLVSIAISAKFTAEMLEELYEGIKMACDFYKADLVGGDTTSSYSGLVISITATGIADEKNIARRSGAAENDLICVSGDLGAAYMGLQVLERETKIFTETNGPQPDLSAYGYILERQLKPEARHDIIEKLEEKGIVPTSMIDISDGLSSELLHLTRKSGTGCRIYTERIPIADETRAAMEEMGLEPLTIALNGGEDYELLFTVPLEKHALIKEIGGISIIGNMTDRSEGCYMVSTGGSAVELHAMGWDGLKKD